MIFAFVCAEHEDFGCKGWRLKSQPDFDPLGGMAVAHDCLEHFTDSAEPADEFMALGASLWIRDSSYYAYKGQHCVEPGENIASDLPEIMRHVTCEGYGLRTAPHTRCLDEDTERQIQLMKRVYSEELPYMGGDDRMRISDTAWDSITSWVRIGYRKAMRRYHHQRSRALGLFLHVESEADRLLRYAEEWQELNVSVNLTRLAARVVLCEPEADWY